MHSQMPNTCKMEVYREGEKGGREGRERRDEEVKERGKHIKHIRMYVRMYVCTFGIGKLV